MDYINKASLDGLYALLKRWKSLTATSRFSCSFLSSSRSSFSLSSLLSEPAHACHLLLWSWLWLWLWLLLLLLLLLFQRLTAHAAHPETYQLACSGSGAWVLGFGFPSSSSCISGLLLCVMAGVLFEVAFSTTWLHDRYAQLCNISTFTITRVIKHWEYQISSLFNSQSLRSFLHDDH